MNAGGSPQGTPPETRASFTRGLRSDEHRLRRFDPALPLGDSADIDDVGIAHPDEVRASELRCGRRSGSRRTPSRPGRARPFRFPECGSSGTLRLPGMWPCAYSSGGAHIDEADGFFVFKFQPGFIHREICAAVLSSEEHIFLPS
jgi:hypothetical protein